MKRFDTRVYSISDFLEWRDNGLLDLSPDFQRRAVWPEKAKSYLIDSLLRGKPIPKLILTQRLDQSRSVRIVVDGQQRLRAILEFVDGAFKISSAHNKELANSTFEDLPDDTRRDFLKYELGVDLLFDPQYEELLDIFARINTFTVTLNRQEQFNAKYLGYFKQAVYSYGFRYVDYYLRAGILTKAQVTRMREAELTADLLVALLDEVQTNKTVENFYKRYEDNPGELDLISTRFDSIMTYVGTIYPPEEIAGTNWSRIHLFYTLFVTIGHLLFGVGGLGEEYARSLTPDLLGRVRVRLDEVSAKYDTFSADLDHNKVPSAYRQFIQNSRRGTTDTAARIERANFVCAQLADVLA